MKLRRSSGLLMHITSLPGKYGIGTMGPEAYEFVDLLVEGGQRYWQVLPVGPVTSVFGYSPYASASSFAGNYFFINLQMLQEEDWMRNYIMSDWPENQYSDFVDFESVADVKWPMLKKMAVNFFKYADEKAMELFHRFCEESNAWLGDYALFMSLADHFNSFNWLTWDKDIRFRKPAAVKRWNETLKPEVDFHKFLQFVFYRQWFALKQYANDHGIQVFGDIPIYVTFDSADAWAHPEIFQLDEETRGPKKVAGVPPDYFSKTGQLWGNPLYRWFEKDDLKKETVEWWAERIAHAARLFDVTRIDHFRGFEAYWAVPMGEETAVNGQWEKGPGRAFFKKIKKILGKKHSLPLIAEDLGVITPEVEKLRDDLDLPGMKILQFAFDHNNRNAYLPHNYTTTNCVVYTGTHDNNTTNGWFYEHEVDERTRAYILDYMRLNHRHEFHWQLINLALGSIADLAMFPVWDVLGYAGKFRMNTPGSAQGNWTWKLTPGRLTPELMQKLKKACVLYNRA